MNVRACTETACVLLLSMRKKIQLVVFFHCHGHIQSNDYYYYSFSSAHQNLAIMCFALEINPLERTTKHGCWKWKKLIFIIFILSFFVNFFWNPKVSQMRLQFHAYVRLLSASFYCGSIIYLSIIISLKKKHASIETFSNVFDVMKKPLQNGHQST